MIEFHYECQLAKGCLSTRVCTRQKVHFGILELRQTGRVGGRLRFQVSVFRFQTIGIGSAIEISDHQQI